MKPIWIASAGSYRTASTTHYQMARDIIEACKQGRGIGYHTESRLKDFDNTEKGPFVLVKVFRPFFLPDIRSDKMDEPSRFVALHEEERLRALVTIRNPLDIISSMKKRNEGRDDWDFETTAKKLSGWLKDSCEWIDKVPSMVSRYEVFTADLHAEVRKIAEFLDIPINTPDVNKIARNYTIDSMNRRARRIKEKNRKAPPEAQEKEDPWLPSVPGVVFGTSGIWVNWLSGVEQRQVRESCGWFIERFGYE